MNHNVKTNIIESKQVKHVLILLILNIKNYLGQVDFHNLTNIPSLGLICQGFEILWIKKKHSYLKNI